MEPIIGIGGVVAVLALFGGLSRLEAGRRRRMIADVSKPTRRFDLSGDLLPREETSLGPVDYRRIPSAAPVGYVQTTQQARHAPTIETLFILPALTALGSAVALTIAAGGLALLFGWPAKTLLIVFAVSVGGAWFWRLGFADKVLWQVESWTKKDLDGDGLTGNPANVFPVADPGQARSKVARSERAAAEDARRAALLAFADKCYLSGTSEGSHGIQASGPDRDNYTACRDTFFRLGLARWKNPNRTKGGWVMVADPATCKGILEQHAL